ncbi:hypothetical protein PTTG_05932, partial [Puccinia triticina 1-1 BBBD Race 1]
MREFGIIYNMDPDQSHQFTKSVHNQKIECLWLQLMKQYNSALIKELYDAKKQEYYDPKDPLQSANTCYENPEEFDLEEGLIPVKISAVEELENEHYPNHKNLMATSPSWFKKVISDIKSGMEIEYSTVDHHNVWDVFSLLHTAMIAYNTAWIEDETNDPSESISARACSHFYHPV